MLQQFPRPLLLVLFIALMVTAPSLWAETNVQVRLERMLNAEETRGIPLGKKIEMEGPSLSCKGTQAKINLTVTMYRGEELLSSMAGEQLACGGKRAGVSSGKVVGMLNSMVKKMQGSSKHADNFLPGDQFLGKNTFGAGAYKDGSIVGSLSKELRVELGSKTWLVITAVGSSAVKSNPWVIVANEGMETRGQGKTRN